MRILMTSSVALAALMTLTATSAFAAKSPEDFVKDAIQTDNSEIMLGRFAQDTASTPRVKDFGRMLVTDHTKARDEAVAVASKLGVTPSDQTSPEANDEKTKLSKLTGAAFDSEFANFMVTAHKKDIQAFQDEANANQGPASDLAKMQLPVLQHHAEMAETLVKEGGGSAMKGASNGSTMKAVSNEEGPDQWRASKLAGVAIYGPDDKKVGSITDILVNKDGKAEFVIIGVGGFLGIGEKDVSVAFDQVKFADKPITPPTPATTDNASPLGATTTATDPAAAANANRSGAYPDHGMIDMTADQLKQAPTFKFAS